MRREHAGGGGGSGQEVRDRNPKSSLGNNLLHPQGVGGAKKLFSVRLRQPLFSVNQKFFHILN